MKKVLFLTFVLCLNVFALMAQQKVPLSFNPDKKITYEYDYAVKQHIKQQVMGQEIEMDQTIACVYVMNVLTKNKNEITVSFTYKDISYEMLNPMMSVRYDSKNPGENLTEVDQIMKSVFDNLIDKEFVVVITSDGTVKSVSGMDAVVDDIIKRVGNDANMRTMLDKQIGDEAMRKSFEQTLKIYPVDKVGVGDTWSVGQVLDLFEMSLSAQNTYQLKSFDKKTAVISLSSIIDSSDNLLSGTQAGSMEINRKTGMTQKTFMQQELKGTVAVQGMNFPIEMSSGITVTTREIK